MGLIGLVYHEELESALHDKVKEQNWFTKLSLRTSRLGTVEEQL